MTPSDPDCFTGICWAHTRVTLKTVWLLPTGRNSAESPEVRHVTSQLVKVQDDHQRAAAAAGQAGEQLDV